MKIRMLEDFQGTEAGGQSYKAGDEPEVGDTLAAYLFTHHKAEPVDAPAKKLKTKTEADAKQAAADEADRPVQEALASLADETVKVGEAHRTARDATVARLAAELQAADDARLIAERKAEFVAKAEKAVAKAEKAEAKAAAKKAA